jgi:hypothetical protein
VRQGGESLGGAEHEGDGGGNASAGGGGVVLGGGAEAARHLGAGVEAPAAGGRDADDYEGSGGSSVCRRG